MSNAKATNLEMILIYITALFVLLQVLFYDH